MCGRYTLHLADLSALVAALGVSRMLVPSWQPRFNIAPTQLAPVVRRPGEGELERSLELLAFGLVPSWSAVHGRAGRPSTNRLINARVETVATLRSFRGAFEHRRCVVPATGFFEWQAVAGQRAKQPYWIHPPHGGVMHLAGLWEPCVSRDGVISDTFAIVTTAARGQLQAIHDRMPIELGAADVDGWLARGPLDPRVLERLVRDISVERLQTRAVGRAVGSPSNDDAHCIEASSPEDQDSEPQLELFATGDHEA